MAREESSSKGPDESFAPPPNNEVIGLDRPEALKLRWGHWRVAVRSAEAETLVADVSPENLLRVLGDARDPSGPGYKMLMDLTAVDQGAEAKEARFELVYLLRRPGGPESLRVRVVLPGGAGSASPESDSICGLWPSANWLEREVFDLFGIHFRGHPDLRRLLLPADFEGAPLRKDYPRQPNLPLPKWSEGVDGVDGVEGLESVESVESEGVAADEAAATPEVSAPPEASSP